MADETILQQKEEKHFLDEDEAEDEDNGARVCTTKYPKGFYRYQKKDGFYMWKLLRQQIDYYIQNVVNDWDFTIIICGEGEVRVGKSVLAMQVAAYWVDQMEKKHGVKLPFNLQDNFVFDGRKLIEKGNYLGQKHKYSPLIFDEAGADLEGAKSMMANTRAVKDFLRECGQYNLLNILVLPEYFDLPKGIALSRSACLINVYYIPDNEGNFRRGYFKFYGRPNKKALYLRGKKDLDYNAAPYDFFGTFGKFYPFNKDEYDKLKFMALKKREATSVDKRIMQRNIAWWLLTDKFEMSQSEIAKISSNMGAYTAQQTIAEALKGVSLSSVGTSDDDTP